MQVYIDEAEYIAFSYWKNKKYNTWPEVFRKNDGQKALHAMVDYDEGQAIDHFDGLTLSREEMRALNLQKGDPLQVGDNTFLCMSVDSDCLYINHSCDPNCFVSEYDGSYYLRTRKPIKAGDELTFDYSTTMLHGTWQLDNCQCKSSNCRGTIKPFNTLPKDLQKQYYESEQLLPFVSQYYSDNQ